MIFRSRSRDADDHSACVRIPPGRTEPLKGGHDHNAARVLDLGCIVFAIRRRLDDFKTVSEPLYSRTAGEYRALERVGHLVSNAPTDGRNKSVGGHVRLLAGVHKQERTRTVGVLHLSLVKAALTEQSRLLVARNTRDGELSAEHARVGVAEKTGGGHNRREHRYRNIKELEQVPIPF